MQLKPWRNGMPKNNKRIKVLKRISQDMADDARNFDFQPFNGKIVAEYFGNQGAAIAALADILTAQEYEKDA
jgi:hypothetical protein